MRSERARVCCRMNAEGDNLVGLPDKHAQRHPDKMNFRPTNRGHVYK